MPKNPSPNSDNPNKVAANPKLLARQRRLAVLVLLGMALWMGAFGWFGLQLGYMRAAYQGEEQLIVIAPGTGVRGIAKQLTEAGVVHSEPSFIVTSVVFGLHHRFKAGEYQIKPGQTGRQIADAIANGR